MPAPIDYIKIQYPRKCVDCDYIANNPAMYSYHKNTHSPIPLGTYCHFGCGCLATYKNTGGKYTCKEKYQDCAEYLNQLSARTKESWADSGERKEKTKQSLKERLHNDVTYKKQSITKRKKSGLITPELVKDYRHYARSIRRQAQQWARGQGYTLGKQTYHVDHKFSILDSWKLKLPATIVNHPYNLQLLEAKINSSKGSKSTITLKELLEASINSPDQGN
jgi:hypothetical protein